jgi:hypothetical protein
MTQVKLPRQDVAYAAAMDAANRRMRAEGRTTWNQEDYAAAVAAYNTIIEEAKGDC